ncbi:hypothetical protein JMUB7504_27370 [Staphylococcus aureus]
MTARAGSLSIPDTQINDGVEAYHRKLSDVPVSPVPYEEQTL